MDQNNQGLEPGQDSVDLAKQYQDILDRYSKELASVPAEPAAPAEPAEPAASVANEVAPEVAPPEPIVVSPEPAPAPPAPSVPPIPEAPALPPVTVPTTPASIITPVFDPPLVVTPPKKNNFFKILFFISLIIFIGVAVTVAYTLYSRGQLPITGSTPKISTTPTLDQNKICQLNDKQYQVGEGFPSADGCNTCSCSSDLTIVCTEKACAPTSVPTPSITYKLFTEKTLGFTLKYPENYGSLDITFTKPVTLKKFKGSFSRNLLITLTDFPGYTNNQGQIKFNSAFQSLDPANIIEIYKNNNGLESVIGKNIEAKSDVNYVLVNLNNPGYPGVIFSFDKLVTLPEIKSLLDGLTITPAK